MEKTTNTTDDFDLNKWFAEMSAKSPFIAIPAEDCEKCEIERLKKIIEEKDRIISLLAGVLDKVTAFENWPYSSSGGTKPEITQLSRKNAPETPSHSSDVENLRWVNPEGVK